MSKNCDRGFTLIEVLVAFAILLMVLGASYRSLSDSMSGARTARAVSARVLEVRSIFDRVGADIPLAPGAHQGRFANGENWRLVIASETAADDVRARPRRMFALELTVFGNASVAATVYRKLVLGRG